MPNHVGMQRPEVLPSRIAHASPRLELHSEVCVQAFAPLCASMPCAFETPSSTPVTPNALPYLVDAGSLVAPSHLTLMLS
jgi:hypothetical protein